MVGVFREIRRVLSDDGTLWLNLGDSYAGSGKGASADGVVRVSPTSKQATSVGTTQGIFRKTEAPGLKPKDLIGIPWKVAFALQADGWYLRSDIIWHKPNPMPESVTDRPTKSHEYVFLLSKSPKYYYDHEAIKEPALTPPTTGRVIPYSAHTQTGGIATQNLGTSMPDGKRNKRDVWTIPTKPYKGAHFAVMPIALVEPCLLAGSEPNDTVLDPFTGSGTVGVVALRHGRNFTGIELNPTYAALAHHRIESDQPMLNTVTSLPPL
jgi:DNA modification methylase